MIRQNVLCLGFCLLSSVSFLGKAQACNSYDDANTLRNGGSVVVDSTCSVYDIINLANVGKSLLTVNLHGISTYDATNIVHAGASFDIDSSFSVYDIQNICGALVSPALGVVDSKDISAYDLQNISSRGCTIQQDSSGLSAYDAMIILQRGGSVETGIQFSVYDTENLAHTGGARLFVHLHGFSSYDSTNIVQAGASFYLDQSFSVYDMTNICRAKVSPARGSVYSEGISTYDLNNLKSAGCAIVPGADPF